MRPLTEPARPALHLSSISYALGAPRSVSELGIDEARAAALAEDGIRCYRRSDREPWELAASAAGETLTQAAIRPDFILYASEGRASNSVGWDAARAVEELDLARVPFLALSGHVCANLAPALELAAA